MRISDWSSDVCSSDLADQGCCRSRDGHAPRALPAHRRVAVLSVRRALQRRRSERARGQLDRRPHDAGPVMSSFDLPLPEVFTAGAVGEPGSRVFYLQVREEQLVVSLRCEKQQVAALADYFEGLLEDLEPAP